MNKIDNTSNKAIAPRNNIILDEMKKRFTNLSESISFSYLRSIFYFGSSTEKQPKSIINNKKKQALREEYHIARRKFVDIKHNIDYYTSQLCNNADDIRRAANGIHKFNYLAQLPQVQNKLKQAEDTQGIDLYIQQVDLEQLEHFTQKYRDIVKSTYDLNSMINQGTDWAGNPVKLSDKFDGDCSMNSEDIRFKDFSSQKKVDEYKEMTNYILEKCPELEKLEIEAKNLAEESWNIRKAEFSRFFKLSTPLMEFIDIEKHQDPFINGLDLAGYNELFHKKDFISGLHSLSIEDRKPSKKYSLE